MAIAAPQVNPAHPPVGVTVDDDIGIYAMAKKRIKPDAIAHVRQYVQDEAAKNPLLTYQREFTDGQIAVAILAATDHYNAIPPIAAVTTVTPTVGMPFNIFLDVSAVELFKTSYISRLRNEVAYSDAGVSVDLTKSDKYMAALDKFNARITEEIRRHKISRNVQSIGSFVPSSYLFLFLVS